LTIHCCVYWLYGRQEYIFNSKLYFHYNISYIFFDVWSWWVEVVVLPSPSNPSTICRQLIVFSGI
jgi:hypothetical protein